MRRRTAIAHRRQKGLHGKRGGQSKHHQPHQHQPGIPSSKRSLKSYRRPGIQDGPLVVALFYLGPCRKHVSLAGCPKDE